MVENGKKHRQNSHQIIHFPTSEGVRANEQTDERVALRGGEQIDLGALQCEVKNDGGPFDNIIS